MHNYTAKSWITTLNLIRHPEGGCFRETYRSAGSIPEQGLPEDYHGSRSFSTAIYFLLAQGEYSAFHRLKSDEIWHFYHGAPISIHLISPAGEYEQIILGQNPGRGECFQAVIPAGCWFGAETEGEYSLAGCTVAPGFDFADFEMADPESLKRGFPQHEQLVNRLSKR